ncbi:hypothetical protein, conserved [Trypanosoma brucei brucei TREU927]|uniref:Uncharacterized protein n=1 Tax=Trypanosoma brucei brucei (strain 927/4 GUTat10.1) TaxID=185431 RepID=Q57XJ3_TRYB2|nr:hypothetical protein, conserved [Trypanosoma brucei brucei TREU927]AAX69676.1 hypothetical protein, conserved [Trypanosoma brucei]AAZ10376.1 hypothetical protein, conserved [Trypanosoma brucei brucei TREU927]
MLIGMKYSAPKAIVISLHFPKSRSPYIGTHFHVVCYEGDGPWKHLLQPAECWCSKLLTGKKKCATTARHHGMPRTFEVPMSIMGIHNHKRILNRGIFIFVPNRIYFINNREFLLTRRTCVYFDTTANTFPKKKKHMYDGRNQVFAFMHHQNLLFSRNKKFEGNEKKEPNPF